jgi:NADP-dependent alcohol dehydrogenase
VVENPKDYALASNFMSCTMALNGLIQGCLHWATHMIGHELTAMYGIDARTLAVIAPSLKLCLKPKEKLAQYGKRIFNLTGTDDEIANEAIAKTVEFFHTMGMDTKLSDYTKTMIPLIL